MRRYLKLKPSSRICLLALLASSPLLAEEKKVQTEKSASPAVEITVAGERVNRTKDQTPGTTTVITAEDLTRNGVNDFGGVVRYEPLVSAPFNTAGMARNGFGGSSSFDRGGYTGYNIRGIEANRLSLEIDGIELPNAVARPYVSRIGVNSFGIGRGDYVDPELFSSIEIQSGTTGVSRSNSGIGGGVSFRTKSPEDYLSPNGNPFYVGYKLSYGSLDESLAHSVTAAARSGNLQALVAYVRRDGNEQEANGSVPADPADWNSNAVLTKFVWTPASAHKFDLSVAYNDRTADYTERLNTNTTTGNQGVASHSNQHSFTDRWAVTSGYRFTPTSPTFVDALQSKVYYQKTTAHDVTRTGNPPTAGIVPADSQYNTDQLGFDAQGQKRLNDSVLVSSGVNASVLDTERPLTGAGVQRPQTDTRTTQLGAFAEFDISYRVAGRRLSFIPGVRADRKEIEPRNLENFAGGGTTAEDAALTYRTTTNSYVTPTLSIAYDLTQKLSAYVQYKRGNRMPTANELTGSWNMDSNYNPPSYNPSTGVVTGGQYALVGNSNLKKETSDSLEAGLKGELFRGVTFRGAVFYTSYHDFIAYVRRQRAFEWTLDANGNRQFDGNGRPIGRFFGYPDAPDHIGIVYGAENRDGAHIYGGEFSTRVDLGAWSTSARGFSVNAALGYSKGSSKVSVSGENRELDTIPPFKGVVSASYDARNRRFGLSLLATFTDGKRADASASEGFTVGNPTPAPAAPLFRVPGATVYDLTGYWRFNDSATLNVGVTNLSDKRYWDYQSARYLQPGNNVDIERALAPGIGAVVSLSLRY